MLRVYGTSLCVRVHVSHTHTHAHTYAISVFSDLVRVSSLPSTSEPPVPPTRASARFIAMCRKGGRPAGRPSGNGEQDEKDRKREAEENKTEEQEPPNDEERRRGGTGRVGRRGAGGPEGRNDGTCERRSERGGDPRAIMLYSVLVRLPAGYLRRRRLTARVFRDTAPSARKNVRLSSRRPVSSLTARSAGSFLSPLNGEKARNESARRNERTARDLAASKFAQSVRKSAPVALLSRKSSCLFRIALGFSTMCPAMAVRPQRR